MTRLMYDSVDPNAIPVNAEIVAGYIDGTNYRWPESAWDRFPNSVHVRIARRTYTNDGHVLDVEVGIPTVWPPSRAIVDWVLMRRAAGIEPTIYCNQLNDWEPVRAQFAYAGVPEPLWWVARYNNVATIPAGAIAKQYANPPLAGGHYDLSVVADYWPGVDTKGFLDMLTAEEQRFVYNRIAGILRQRWMRTDENGVVLETTYEDMSSVDGWTPCAVLDTADGNYVVGLLEGISERLANLEASVAQLVGNGVTLRTEGEIVIRASQSDNGGAE